MEGFRCRDFLTGCSAYLFFGLLLPYGIAWFNFNINQNYRRNNKEIKHSSFTIAYLCSHSEL